MTRQLTISEQEPGGINDGTNRTTLGIWVYLMTDCVLFASLFATFAVLRGNLNGGPSGKDIFSMPYVLVETLVLLTSSFTVGLSLLAAQKQRLRQVMAWLTVTGLLGAVFLAMELHEFRNLVMDGNSWRLSGFLSAFFTLVGTHGLHIAIGLIWLVALLAVMSRRGLTATVQRRLTLFGMFWHFLDLIWIFIFTIVYLLGVVKP